MIVDSSVLIAILRGEPEATAFIEAVDRAEVRRLSAANYLESAILIDSDRSPIASQRFDDYVRVAGFLIEPVTFEQVQIARQAYRDYGKGNSNRAQLNYGDCFAYALARDRKEPLLFKGDDFRHTDIEPAL